MFRFEGRGRFKKDKKKVQTDHAMGILKTVMLEIFVKKRQLDKVNVIN